MKKSLGFTLIEVLISMIILSVGLLGLAGLQLAGLKNNQSAYYYSQATQLLYDISDRMHANAPASVRTLTTGQTSPPNGASTSPYLSSAWTGAAPSAVAACATATGCTWTQMAQNDLSQWNTAIAATLPSGVGTVTYNNMVYTVTINWDDNHDGLVNASDPNFSMSFQL